ncbi:MAG: PAN domain-containing protein [Aestuariivirga sp.]
MFGDIRPGDTNELLGIQTTSVTLLFLASDGGDANEGLAIAKLVHKLGWGTAVVGSNRCMSSCALIWIAGKDKFLSKTALVGFHAVYTNDGVSSNGNALFGAFYGQLGLTDRAITYLTQAPPSGYNPVTLDNAPSIDLQVEDWDKVIGTTPAQQSPQAQGTEQISPSNPVSSSNFQNENKVDIIGFDIPGASFKTDSQEPCQAACENSKACAAYTFDIRNHVCYMKSGGRLKLTSDYAFSGANPQLFNQLKLSNLVIFGKQESVGFDYKSLAVNSLEDCVFECDQDNICKAFSYLKAKHQCDLKNGHDNFKANRTIVSGLKSIP